MGQPAPWLSLWSYYSAQILLFGALGGIRPPAPETITVLSRPCGTSRREARYCRAWRGASSSGSEIVRQGYASPPPVARREARLATGLPATALAGLDFHQLDSCERFPSAHVDFPLSQA